MASRSFYWTSAALVAGTATVLVLWTRFTPTPEPTSPAATAPTRDAVDDRALGVRGADYDPASVPVDNQPRSARTFSGNPFAMNTTTERPVRPAPPPGPAAPPIAAGPGTNAASEASVAAQPAVVAALRADLDGRRDGLRKACWPQGSNAAATFKVDVSYAADGSLVTLGVSDVPGLPGVGTCLMGQIIQKPPVLPEPPGVPVAVAVPVAFAGSGPPPPPPTRSLDGIQPAPNSR
jgi:hypothetical protein